jgi:hypothetical protein
MIDKIKQFIKKIQESDETTKKRWIVIFSGLSMVIIVGLWVVYMNAFFNDLSFKNNQNVQMNDNFFSIMKNGGRVVTIEIIRFFKQKAFVLFQYFQNIGSGFFGERIITID